VQTTTGTTEIRVRRFGDGFGNGPLSRPTAGGAVLLVPRADAAPEPWQVRVAPSGRARACLLA
jgi:hypothetical protein